MRCGVFGNGVARLLSPFGKQYPSLIELRGIVGIGCQVVELIRIPTHHVKLFTGTRIRKDLLLLRIRLTRSVCFPQFLAGRKFRIGFIAKVGLIWKVVLDINKVAKTQHPFVVLVDMPVVF